MKISRLFILVSLMNVALTQGQEQSGPPRLPTSWSDKVTVKGDVRLRFDSIDTEGKEQRDRARVRARIGAFAKPGSDIDVGVQLSTAEKNDPVSSNQTLGNGGDRENAYFDLAFFDYHPESITGFHLIGGKMEQPFVKVADHVWDNDYNPEGVAVRYKTGDVIEFHANAGGFYLQEREVGDETTMMGAQALMKMNGEDASYLQAGVSFFGYENIEGMAPLFDPTKSRGNQTDKVISGSTTNLIYANGFTTPEVFAEWFMNGTLPLSVYGSYIVNTHAEEEDTGYLAGIRFGKAKDAGSWEFDYNWRHVEANAVVGALADSDSFGGGTDGEGHRLSGTYQISKTFRSTVTYFMNEIKISKAAEDYDRLQVDFSAKF